MAVKCLGFLMCTQTLMHAFANGVCASTIKKVSMKSFLCMSVWVHVCMCVHACVCVCVCVCVCACVCLCLCVCVCVLIGRALVKIFSIIFCVCPFAGRLVGLVDLHIVIQIVVLHAVRKQMSISVIQTNKTLLSSVYTKEQESTHKGVYQHLKKEEHGSAYRWYHRASWEG